MIRVFFATAIGLLLMACGQTKSTGSTSTIQDTNKTPTTTSQNLAEATFGAGCFWCVEAVFDELEGIISVESGYSGGHVKNPSYKEVCAETTGHAEVARITYDASLISFEELLEVFWTTHDPTTLNRQGADRGTQYRSVVFYHNNDQKSIADRSKATTAVELWENPIVTEISPLKDYYPAEDYHQDYYALNPNYGYCVAVINPKLEKFRTRFADKLKGANNTKKSASQLPEVLQKEHYNPLNSTEQHVILQKGTERAFTGEYHNQKKTGTYICRQCNQALFRSDAKFDSGTGWPSFDDIYAPSAVLELQDADGRRTEIVCGNCDGHLGHVFRGEGFTSKKTRHCVNSVSLNFIPKN